MKTVRLLCLAFAGLMSSTVALAGSDTASGRIHFVGSIVEGGCNVVSRPSLNLQVSCYREGKSHVQTVSLPAAGEAPFVQKLGTVSQRTLPGHPHLKEVTISYF